MRNSGSPCSILVTTLWFPSLGSTRISAARRSISFSPAMSTAIRTAAVSALATRLLAREDVKTLAILGAGVQAASHLRALRPVPDMRRGRAAPAAADRDRADRRGRLGGGAGHGGRAAGRAPRRWHATASSPAAGLPEPPA